MAKSQPEIQVIDVTARNVADAGIYCIKDKKAPGFKAKLDWFKSKFNKGLKIKIVIDKTGKQLGFIEYLPSEAAWRPIKADNYFFIHCIAVFGKEAREKGTGRLLISQCEEDARENNKAGICTMSSDGPWMADKTIFEKNGFTVADRLGRFELMVKLFDTKAKKPAFIDWTKQLAKYKGWHLVYSNQCPWHCKAITEIKQSASENGIKLKIKELLTPDEAKLAPSGFGTFSLIKDGKLLADHYISRTRFENILREQRAV